MLGPTPIAPNSAGATDVIVNNLVTMDHAKFLFASSCWKYCMVSSVGHNVRRMSDVQFRRHTAKMQVSIISKWVYSN